jgi:hypothetical protein
LVIFESKLPALKTIAGINIHSLILGLSIPLIFIVITSCNDSPAGKRNLDSSGMSDSTKVTGDTDDYKPVYALLVSPKNPGPGKAFRILAVGGKNIRKAKITISGASGVLESIKTKTGKELPYWRIDDFPGSSAGNYKVTLNENKKVVSDLEFMISEGKERPPAGVVWKTLHGWDSGREAIYSAWINALFHECDEKASWSSLHEVTQNQDQNFLYNYLSQGEDDPDGKYKVIMQPDCADNPFFMRAYFAWKLGLPFGYHVSDRGSLSHSPNTGQWITNETSGSKTHPVLAFNSFLRKVMDGVHSGTARAALDNEKSDYYPVPLERGALRPGTVFADPYGHTLIITGWVPQTGNRPGLLLSVDAQPDGTIGIKRFWKGNFLFNTSGVVGEPGFKAFRPIAVNNAVPHMMQNKELTASAGFVPYSLQQRKMKSEVFYRTVGQLINPKPLDPEAELLNLVEALYEQLLVRVTSVANGEAYFKSHPGTVINMPSNAAGIFQAGGQWENFSTPNRDLRLLIAMDEVLNFPDKVISSPEDFNISVGSSPEKIKDKLQNILDKRVSGLSVSYTHTDGSIQKLTVGEILKRRDAFEMAYNPNDGIEIRWGAPENSEESAACRRHAPSYQVTTMQKVRKWFRDRMHPPT